MAANTDKFKKLSKRWVGQIGSGGVADNTTTTVPLSSVTNLPTDTAVVVTIDRVDANGVATPNLEEAVVGVVSGSNLVSCVRGVEGTAQAHNAGAVVEVLVTAKGINDLIDGLLVQHDQAGRHTNITASNITASAVVTASSIVTDAITGKTTNGDLTLAGNGTGKVRADARYGTLTTDSWTDPLTFSMATSNYHQATLQGNTTFAVSNVAVGQAFIIRVVQDGTGSRTVTWWSTIKWAGGVAPTLTTTASKADVFGFQCTSSGNYDGFVIGQNL